MPRYLGQKESAATGTPVKVKKYLLIFKGNGLPLANLQKEADRHELSAYV